MAPGLLKSGEIMSSPDSAPALETCSVCAQKTAAEFFRTVKKGRICVLCADRAEKADADAKAAIEDHRQHGGHGWLWKHVAYTAYASVGGLVVRYLVWSYFHPHP